MEVGQMAALLGGMLRTHDRLESELAFEPLDNALRRNRRLTPMPRDHKQLEERLGQVALASSWEEACHLMRVAMRASRARFDWEEHTLFPLLEKSLGRRALTDLGKAFQQRAESSDTWTTTPERAAA